MQSTNLSPLRALRASGSDGLAQFRKRVAGALRRADGRLELAAQSLGISKPTLKRWIYEDEVLSKIDRPGPGKPKDSERRAKRVR
jgi:hypothetical protein